MYSYSNGGESLKLRKDEQMKQLEKSKKVNFTLGKDPQDYTTMNTYTLQKPNITAYSPKLSPVNGQQHSHNFRVTYAQGNDFIDDVSAQPRSVNVSQECGFIRPNR